MAKKQKVNLDAGSTPESSFQSLPGGRRLDIRGRVAQGASNPMGGTSLTRNVSENHYDMQAFTGYATGTVPGSNWLRGQLVRTNAPKFRPPREWNAVDPTDPSSWNTAEF